MNNKINDLKYAGFGIRLMAYIIDRIMLTIFLTILFIPFFIIIVLMPQDSTSPVVPLILILYIIIAMILIIVFVFFYNAYAEASGWQGTLGKKIMGIKVVTIDGNRISLKQSSIRLLMKTLQTSFTSLLYMVAAFTDNKQALHDMVAKTLVINKD